MHCGRALCRRDRIDREILDALQRDARVSYKDLPDRVRRLQERGVIKRFTAEMDPAAFGLTLRAGGLARDTYSRIIATERSFSLTRTSPFIPG